MRFLVRGLARAVPTSVLAALVAVMAVAAALVAAPAPVQAASSSFPKPTVGLDGMRADPFVGEEFFAQSEQFYDVGNPQSTTWTCRVDFGDGTPPAGYWRARFPGSAPCAMYHTYAAPGRYVITMTITDPSGQSKSGRLVVQVTQRPTTSVDGGVEGTAVRLAGPGGAGPVQWTFVPSADQTYDECVLSDTSVDGATLQCADQGTFVVRYDGTTAQTSGEYDVTFVNGAPAPTLTALRTDGSGPGVPVTRVGTGDSVLWSVDAHDPSFFPGGPNGDTLTCDFDFGNGQTQAQGDYNDDACGGRATYEQAGTYTTTVTVTDDSGASATVSRSVEVVRRDVTVRASGHSDSGLSGTVRGVLRAGRPGGRVSFVLPGGRTVTGTVTEVSVYDRHTAGLTGPATVDGRGGAHFYLEVNEPGGGEPALTLVVYRGSHDLAYESADRSEFQVSLDAPTVR